MAPMRYLLAFSFLILVGGQAAAVGLASEYTVVKDVDFQPGKEVRYQYRITQTSGRTMDYSFYKSGDLQDLLSFDPSEFKNIDPGTQALDFDAVLRFPASDEGISPGIHIIKFGVQELNPPALGSGVGFVASTSVETGIRVRVLSSNKSAEVGTGVDSVSEGGDAVLQPAVASWSKLDIDEAYVSIRVLDASGKVVKTFVTEKRRVPAGQRVEFLPIIWSTLGRPAGIYTVESTLFFDGFQTMSTNSFRIGTLKVRITDYTDAIEAGKISPIGITLSSNWNQPIEDVHVTVESKEGLQALRSPNFRMEPFGEYTTTVYWDATSTPPGDYDLVLTTSYAGQETKEAGRMAVTPAGQAAVTERPFSFGMGAVILAILIILVLIGTNLFWYYRSRRKEQHAPEQKTEQQPGKPQ